MPIHILAWDKESEECYFTISATLIKREFEWIAMIA